MFYKKSLIAVSVVGLLASCSSDDDAPPVVVNEDEVITTFVATLTPQTAGGNVVLTSRDSDGDGPNDPVISIVGTLQANTTYNGEITLTNELEDPAEDITAEVKAEDEEHQFFYTVGSGLGSVAYADADANGNPLGLEFTWTTADAATGAITFVLRHEPNKSADGVSDGNIANAGGETDIETTFTVSVQ